MSRVRRCKRRIAIGNNSKFDSIFQNEYVLKFRFSTTAV